MSLLMDFLQDIAFGVCPNVFTCNALILAQVQ